MKVKTVIYATDLSVYCKSAGLYAAFFARQFDAEVLIAHAFTLSQAAMEVEIDPALISEQRKDLEFLLARKAERIKGWGLRTESIVLDGDPRKVLPELAAERGDSLLMLGTHGAGWVERELIGSVVQTVLHSAHSPVCTVGPQVRVSGEQVKQVLYLGDTTARAASYAAWLAGQFNAGMERFSADGTRQILQRVREHAVDLVVWGENNPADFSGVYGLIVNAPCPVLTLLS